MTARPFAPPRRLWPVAAVLVLVAAGGAAWSARPDPHAARAGVLWRELFDPAATLSAGERAAKVAALRTELKGLTTRQRDALFAPPRAARSAAVAGYAALPPAARVKALDARIAQDELLREVLGAGVPTAAGERKRKAAEARLTADERAAYARFRADLAARRAGRGLPPGRGA